MTTGKQAQKLHARLAALGIKKEVHYQVCSMWAKTATAITSLKSLTPAEYATCMQIAGQLLDQTERQAA